jgi:hypothetical protein
VFDEFPDIPINLEVKVDDDQLIQLTYDLILKFGRKDSVVWGSFKDTGKKRERERERERRWKIISLFFYSC